MTPLNKKIIEDFNYALIKSFGEEFNNVDPQVSIAKDTRHADYQVNIAFSLAKKLKKKPQEISQIIYESSMQDFFFPQCGIINLAKKGYFGKRMYFLSNTNVN